MLGRFPLNRHDNLPWKPTDKWRQSMCGKLLGFTASVCQLRSDWSGLKSIFSFGGWNGKHMCWMCLATQPKHDVPYDDVSRSAKWKSMRMTAQAFVALCHANNIVVSPLLSLPGFKLAYVLIDVLHCMDISVSQDVVGAFFYGLIHGSSGFLKGPSIAQRCSSLWAKPNDWYKKTKCPNRLQALVPEMICKSRRMPNQS